MARQYRQYDEGFIGGSEVFKGETFLNLDSRTAFFRFAYSSSPGMAVDIVGKGSKYPLTFKDADGSFLNGTHAYKLHLPKGIPAADFWAVTLYDADTAAGVDRPGQAIPSLSLMDELQYNADGSLDLYFGRSTPSDAAELNWIGTVSGKGFFMVLRLYSPTESYFDRNWKPDDLVKIG